MKDLITTPAIQFLYPIFFFSLLLFIFNTPLENLVSFVEFFLPDYDYVSNLNWKAFR